MADEPSLMADEVDRRLSLAALDARGVPVTMAWRGATPDAMMKDRS